LQVERLERASPPADEAGGEVSDLHAEDGAGVEPTAARDDLPDEAPVRRPAAVDVTRAHDHVGALLGARDHLRQIAGIMRKICIHLQEQVVPAFEPPAEPGDVGRAEPELARPVDDVDPGILRDHPVDDVAGAVGRAVVDEEDGDLRDHGEDGGGDRRRVVALVVGRDDDERLRRHRSEPTPRPHARNAESRGTVGDARCRF
jgi:hypothetical protein